jgi:hypothetical protein
MRGVTAVAASLLLPALTTEDAAALAEDEGLVTHLTSLFLVDEAGDIQQTVPATRKVPLPSPRTHMALARGVVRQSFSHGRTKGVEVEKVRWRSVSPGDGKTAEAAPSSAPAIIAVIEAELEKLRRDRDRLATPRRGAGGGRSVASGGADAASGASSGKPAGVVLRQLTEEERTARARALAESKVNEAEERRRAEEAGALDLSSTTQLIDWNLAPQTLQSGDLSMLASAVEQAIRKAATNKDVVALARTLDLDPVVLIVGLLAHAARSHRTAARITRAIFGGEPPAEASAVLRLLGVERLPACGSTETSDRD